MPKSPFYLEPGCRQSIIIIYRTGIRSIPGEPLLARCWIDCDRASSLILDRQQSFARIVG